MNIGWQLENAVLVQAPAWLVWQMLLDVLHWPSSGTVGLHVARCASPGLPSHFSYTIKPLGLPIRVKAQLENARVMQQLSWQGRFWGITSHVRVNLAVEDMGSTRVSFQERLSGVGLLLFSSLFSMQRLVALNQKWLTALGQEMEARARQLATADLSPITLSSCREKTIEDSEIG